MRSEIYDRNKSGANVVSALRGNLVFFYVDAQINSLFMHTKPRFRYCFILERSWHHRIHSQRTHCTKIGSNIYRSFGRMCLIKRHRVFCLHFVDSTVLYCSLVFKCPANQSKFVLFCCQFDKVSYFDSKKHKFHCEIHSNLDFTQCVQKLMRMARICSYFVLVVFTQFT